MNDYYLDDPDYAKGRSQADAYPLDKTGPYPDPENAYQRGWNDSILERRASLKKYHCYTSQYESVISSDVEACSPEDAAMLAAAEHQSGAGIWTVVQGEPVRVSVGTSTSYTARRTA